jgi:hypothetical protein
MGFDGSGDQILISGSLGMITYGSGRNLSGLLNVDSALGKGTRVQVYIPLSEEAADRLHHGTM